MTHFVIHIPVLISITFVSKRDLENTITRYHASHYHHLYVLEREIEKNFRDQPLGV